jgi:hypothetical protein
LVEKDREIAGNRFEEAVAMEKASVDAIQTRIAALRQVLKAGMFHLLTAQGGRPLTIDRFQAGLAGSPLKSLCHASSC